MIAKMRHTSNRTVKILKNLFIFSWECCCWSHICWYLATEFSLTLVGVWQEKRLANLLICSLCLIAIRIAPPGSVHTFQTYCFIFISSCMNIYVHGRTHFLQFTIPAIIKPKMFGIISNDRCTYWPSQTTDTSTILFQRDVL